jgi:hypothetical protein
MTERSGASQPWRDLDVLVEQQRQRGPAFARPAQADVVPFGKAGVSRLRQHVQARPVLADARQFSQGSVGRGVVDHHDRDVIQSGVLLERREQAVEVAFGLVGDDDDRELHVRS